MTEQSPRRGQWRFVAAIVILAGIWLAMLLGGTGALDRAGYEALYAGNRPALLLVARAFTALGEPTVLVSAGFLLAGWIWWRRHPHLERRHG